MKARKVIEKAPEKSRNIAKLGTFIDMTPVSSTVKHLYKMLLNYKRLIIWIFLLSEKWIWSATLEKSMFFRRSQKQVRFEEEKRREGQNCTLSAQSSSDCYAEDWALPCLEFYLHTPKRDYSRKSSYSICNSCYRDNHRYYDSHEYFEYGLKILWLSHWVMQALDYCVAFESKHGNSKEHW